MYTASFASVIRLCYVLTKIGTRTILFYHVGFWKLERLRLNVVHLQRSAIHKSQSLEKRSQFYIMKKVKAASTRHSEHRVKEGCTAAFLPAKKLFEDERDNVLSEIPDEIKRWYGQIAFMPWKYAFLLERVYLPVLVLSPYDVSSNFRKKWERKYKEVCSPLICSHFGFPRGTAYP